jgi:hypothetical protein
MDYLAALAVAGLAGSALTVTVLGLAAWLAQERSDRKRIENVLLTVSRNTKAIEPVTSALDSQRDFQLVLLSLGDLIDYAARISPEATKRLIREKAPQLFEERIG